MQYVTAQDEVGSYFDVALFQDFKMIDSYSQNYLQWWNHIQFIGERQSSWSNWIYESQ
jgi:hypothetical protein